MSDQSTGQQDQDLWLDHDIHLAAFTWPGGMTIWLVSTAEAWLEAAEAQQLLCPQTFPPHEGDGRLPDTYHRAVWQCTGTTRKGHRCTFRGLPGTGRCHHHKAGTP